MNKHDAGELSDLQAIPLEEKINLTKRRIVDWNDHFRGNVFVSFSGGKDSTVLLDLVRETLCDDSIPAVFANTGLEYAQIQRFVRETPNSEIIRPRMRFDEVIYTYGYPIISKEVSEAIYYARKIRNSDSADAKTPPPKTIGITRYTEQFQKRSGGEQIFSGFVGGAAINRRMLLGIYWVRTGIGSGTGERSCWEECPEPG